MPLVTILLHFPGRECILVSSLKISLDKFAFFGKTGN